jgi:TPR repeat protein
MRSSARTAKQDALAQRSLHAKPPRWASYFKHLRAAALDGDVKSQLELGLWYFDGKRSGLRMHLPRSPRLGFKWVERAALGGDADAMDRLGSCFDDGEGVSRNTRLGRLWYRRAVRAGSALAAGNLGASYRATGERRLAERWFWQAAEGGDDDARLSWCRSVLLRRISSSLRTLALSQLQRLARTSEGYTREEAANVPGTRIHTLIACAHRVSDKELVIVAREIRSPPLSEVAL